MSVKDCSETAMPLLDFFFLVMASVHRRQLRLRITREVWSAKVIGC